MLSAYNENVWNDEKEPMHERIKSLHDSGKVYRTSAKLLNKIKRLLKTCIQKKSTLKRLSTCFITVLLKTVA